MDVCKELIRGEEQDAADGYAKEISARLQNWGKPVLESPIDVVGLLPNKSPLRAGQEEMQQQAKEIRARLQNLGKPVLESPIDVVGPLPKKSASRAGQEEMQQQSPVCADVDVFGYPCSNMCKGTNEIYSNELTDAGRMEMLECLRLKKSLPECLTTSPHITAEVGNDYATSSVAKVKVLLYKPDICKLMTFIARGAMESDRCKICPAHTANVDYAFLQKTYFLLGQQLGMRGWDLMPFRHLARVERIISIWCPGFSDFSIKLQKPDNCFYAGEKYFLSDESVI